MIRILRIFISIIRGKFRKKANIRELTQETYWVWPTDVDVSYLNQSIYLLYFEFARWAWIYRLSLDRVMKELDCLPVTASQSIRIKRPLKRFDKIRVTTELQGWDDKWVYMEHRIFRDKKLIAAGLIKGLLRSKSGLVTTRDLFERVGEQYPGPFVPEAYVRFQESEDLMLGDTHLL